MSKSFDILVMTADRQTDSAIRAASESLPAETTVNVYQDFRGLKARLLRGESEGRPQVVLVDIDRDPKESLFELSKIAIGFANVHCVVVSKEFNEDLVLQAMQAGARNFLRRGALAAELGAVLGKLLAWEAEPAGKLGQIISVFSCGGGCGASTMAVNLAHELRVAESKSVLVVDLDEHYGSVAQYLGVSGRYGVAHVLGRKGAIDKHLIETSTVQAGNGVDVLLSPAVAEADSAQTLDYGNLTRLLDACCDAHDYVIVDAPRVPQQAMADLAAVSSAAVVVFQLMVRDVTRAKAVVNFLTTQKMSRDRILPVANRVRKRGPLLRLEDSRSAIGLPSVCRVRNHWRLAVKSVTHGRPLGLTAKRSGLRHDYRKIAAQLTSWTKNGD